MSASQLLWVSTWKLSRLRVRLWWNGIKHSNWRRKLAYGAAGVGLLAFAIFLVLASWGILTFLSDPRLAAAMRQAGIDVNLGDIRDRLPVMFSAGAFLAGAFTSFGVLLQSLYLSGDMEFLLAAPLPPRAVFASKLIQAILPNLVMLGLFSGPALVGLGFSQGYHGSYFVLLPVVLVTLVTSGAGLSAVLVMAVVRVVSPRRAAEVLGLLGGLIGILCSQTGQFTDRLDLSADSVAGAFGALESLASAWNPLAWPGRGLSEIGQRHWATGSLFTALTLGLSLGLLALTLTVSERMYFSGWARVQVGGTARRRAPARERPAAAGAGAASRFLGGLLPAPVKALIAKDARMYRRDLRNLSQLVTPILLAVIWTMTLGRNSRDPDLPSGAQTFLRMGSVGIAMFMGWMFAMRFAMGAFSMEGRNWWILKISPLKHRHLLLAKFLVAMIPSAGLSLGYLLVASLMRRVPLALVAYQGAAVLLVIGAECGLMLAFGVWTARFDWDNPREISGGIGGCLGTLAALAFLAVASGLFIGVPILGESLGLPGSLGTVLGLASGTLLCALVGLGPLWFARKRLDALGGV